MNVLLLLLLIEYVLSFQNDLNSKSDYCIQYEEDGNNTCVKCKKGTYLNDDNECVSDDMYCSYYSHEHLYDENTTVSESQCSMCYVSYYYNTTTHKCEKGTIDNCIRYNTTETTLTCISCLEGYVLKGNKCEYTPSCKDNCRTCSVDHECIECKEGYQLNYTKCVKCNINNCKSCYTDINKCNVCKDDYILDNNQCIKNVSNNNAPLTKNLNEDCYDSLTGLQFYKNNKTNKCELFGCLQYSYNHSCVVCFSVGSFDKKIENGNGYSHFSIYYGKNFNCYEKPSSSSTVWIIVTICVLCSLLILIIIAVVAAYVIVKKKRNAQKVIYKELS